MKLGNQIYYDASDLLMPEFMYTAVHRHQTELLLSLMSALYAYSVHLTRN